MSVPQRNTRLRHLIKATTWRVIGTLDTVLLSWFITGDGLTGIKIGIAEVVTKMLLYYAHERLWFKLNIGPDGLTLDSKRRHLLKTITWRVLGSSDTMVLSWVISGNPFTGLKIGGAELVTKMILYYLHERVWYRLDFGLPSRHNEPAA